MTYKEWKNHTCKDCGLPEFVFIHTGPHIGVYCSDCGQLQGYVRKNDISKLLILVSHKFSWPEYKPPVTKENKKPEAVQMKLDLFKYSGKTIAQQANGAEPQAEITLNACTEPGCNKEAVICNRRGRFCYDHA